MKTVLFCVIAPVVLVSLIAMLSGKPVKEVLIGRECQATATVVSIDSIISRGGYVTLDNGEQVNVGQPGQEIKVGSKICVKW